MFDCLTVCNSACIACIWCILFSKCFPSVNNARVVDSSEYCSWKRSNDTKYMSRFAQCCLSCTETLTPPRSRARNGPPYETSDDKYKYRVSLKEEYLGPCIEAEYGNV